MADTGLKNPTSTGSPSNQWSVFNPTNAYVSDNNYTHNPTDNQKQDYADFTLGVPSGATINGVEIKVEAKAQNTAFSPREIYVDLSWNAGTTYTTIKTTGNLTTSDVIYTLGGATDLWGRSWSDTEFSNTNFRLRITTNIGTVNDLSVDHLQVKVYYTEAAASDISKFHEANWGDANTTHGATKADTDKLHGVDAEWKRDGYIWRKAA